MCGVKTLESLTSACKGLAAQATARTKGREAFRRFIGKGREFGGLPTGRREEKWAGVDGSRVATLEGVLVAKPAKRSFEDRCVPKLELGNECSKPRLSNTVDRAGRTVWQARRP